MPPVELSIKYNFTSWTKWESREELPGIAAPGVYAIAITEKDIGGQKFKWVPEIVYFGVSDEIKGRLKNFHRVISQKAINHSGARKLTKQYPDYSILLPRLYVAIHTIGRTSFQKSPDCWKKLGDARQLECYCIAEYLKLYGQNPRFNF